MKKSIVLFALILLCAGALMAQQSISVAPYIQLSSSTVKTTTTTKTDSFEFGVSVPIVLDSGMEVAPYLGIKGESKTGSANRATYLDLGSGVFWSMFGNSIFTLKTGPDANLKIQTGFTDLYDTDLYNIYGNDHKKTSYFELGVKVPLILDIKLNDRFSVRVKQNIVSMSVSSTGAKDVSDNKVSKTTFRFNSFSEIFEPTFAFVIKVK